MKRQTLLLTAASCVALITAVRHARAVDFTWVSVGGTQLFRAPANWNPNGTPNDNADRAIFNLGAMYDVDFRTAGPAPDNVITNQSFEVRAGTVTFDLFEASPLDDTATYRLDPPSGTLPLAAIVGTTNGVSATLIVSGTPGPPNPTDGPAEIDAEGALRIASAIGSTGRVDIGILNQPWRTTWTSNSLTQIATSGTGTLNVFANNSLVDAGAQIGVGGTAVGTVNIRGAWTNNGDMTVGLLGDGDLNILAGTVNTNGDASIGTAILGTPSGRADLTGGDWSIDGSLTIGTASAGAGVLTINSTASAVAVGGAMSVRSRGDVDLANGQLTVNGALTLNAGSTLDLAGGHLKTSPATFTVPTSTFNWTSGKLEFTTPYTIETGHLLGGSSLTVGANKEFIVKPTLNVGTGAAGTLTVNGGGMVAGSSANLGGIASPGTSASATIAGAGSIWDLSGALTVADDVAANLTVNAGGVLKTASALASNAAGSNSNIDLMGANTLWANTGSAHLGGNAMAAGGPGTLDITSGAKMTVGNLLKVWELFTVTVDGGTIETAHLDVLGTLNVSGTSTVKATGNVNITSGADVTFSPASTFNAAGATINISGAATVIGAITGNAMTSATVASNGTTWTMPGSLEIGTASSGLGRIGSLALQTGSVTNVAGNVTVLDATKFSLTGGTLNAMSFDAGDQDFSGTGGINARFSTGGDVTATGNLTIGDANSFNGVLIGGNLNVGTHTVTINKKGFFNVGLFTDISGGTLVAPGGVSLPTGNALAATGAVNARIAAQAGSTIEATGNLALGDATAVDGYFSDGVLLVNEHTVTLGDANQAVVGSLTQLGRAGMAGTLVAGNGAAVELGKNVVGFGTLDTPNNPLKPLVNNGHIGGNSAMEKITLNGYVKGVGTFDNVTFSGTFSPGFSPATINMGGNVEFGESATLEIEIGGLTPGTQHDRVNIAGQATLNGTLELSLINGFVPAPGDSFTVMTFGSRSGTFSQIVQPPTFQFNAVYSATDLILFAMLPTGEKIWAVDANGNASVGSNWTGGVAPGGVGDAAAFTNIIAANRTVTLDAPLTLGTVRFDDDNNYTLTGNAFTLQAAGATAAVIDVRNMNGNGAHTIAAPVVAASNLEITQQSSGTLTLSGPMDNSTGRSITKSGAGPLVLSGAQSHGTGAALLVEQGTLIMNTDAGSAAIRNLAITANSSSTFGSTQHLAGLSIGASATAQLTAGGSKNVVTGSLTIAGGSTPTGTLDITGNAAIVDYPATGPNPETTIREQIISGRGGSGFGATWTGKGVTSSTAASQVATDPESVSVAYAVNGALPLGPYTNFRGEPVDASSVLIRYTRTADANLDGVVNDDDVTIVGATYAPGVPNPNWALGDFDYNGFVDDDDVTLLGVFYDPSAPPLIAPAPVVSAVAAVPEPATVFLSILGALGLSSLLMRGRRDG